MHNITASSFADTIGVQRSNVSHVLGGRNKPSLDFLEKTLNSFPRVNASWLITGKMPANGIENNEASLDSNKTIEVQKNEANPLKTVDIDKPNTNETSSEIEKILVFYKDKTFKEYFPK
ncbi:MAG: transcriptional regulator [Fluviicola sp.]|nr:transcriptional regulator [Fluviicola sp.]